MRIHYQQSHPMQFDKWILSITLIIIAFGLLMVTSASMVISDKQYGYPWHYFLHQVIYIFLGLGLAALTLYVPLKIWRKMSLPLLFVSLLLLVVVLVPGIGHVVNGSRRWLGLGIISLQVSEIVKFSALLYLANYLTRFQQQVQTQFMGFLKPMLLLAAIVLLLLLEPDFGAATVLTAMFLALLFIAGVRLWPYTVLFVFVIAALGLLAITSPYRLERITTFLDPWRSAYGSGYQLTQSLIAFGRGGVFGVGLGNSIQKLFYLPEAHTDFLFAVIAEELGLIGELFLIVLFLLLVARIFRIGRQAYQQNNFFAAFFAYGLALLLSLQTIVNLGVNAGMFPTKGLTLPFMSYGGSSMLINCVVMSIIMRIAHEIRYE